MTDPIDLLKQLQTPKAPPEPPDWPMARPWKRWVFLSSSVLVAAAAGVALYLAPPTGKGQEGLRGPEPKVEVDFRLAVERDGVVGRVRDDELLRTGDRVLFAVGASAESIVEIVVDGPDGKQPIVTVQAGPQATEVRSGTEQVAFRLSRPGTWRFMAMIAGARTCERPSCMDKTLEVR